MSKLCAGLLAIFGSSQAFAPASAPAPALQTRAVSPVMSDESNFSRRALLAAVVLGSPAAANAMIVMPAFPCTTRRRSPRHKLLLNLQPLVPLVAPPADRRCLLVA